MTKRRYTSEPWRTIRLRAIYAAHRLVKGTRQRTFCCMPSRQAQRQQTLSLVNIGFTARSCACTCTSPCNMPDDTHTPTIHGAQRFKFEHSHRYCPTSQARRSGSLGQRKAPAEQHHHIPRHFHNRLFIQNRSLRALGSCFWAFPAMTDTILHTLNIPQQKHDPVLLPHTAGNLRGFCSHSSTVAQPPAPPRYAMHAPRKTPSSLRRRTRHDEHSKRNHHSSGTVCEEGGIGEEHRPATTECLRSASPMQGPATNSSGGLGVSVFLHEFGLR